MPRKKQVQPHGKRRAAVSRRPAKASRTAPIPAIKPPAPTAPLEAAERGQVGVPRRNGRVIDLRDMTRQQLEAYAMELGLMRRALELSDERLRQNIQAFIAEMME